jgi:hypothetical protein
MEYDGATVKHDGTIMEGQGGGLNNIPPPRADPPGLTVTYNGSTANVKIQLLSDTLYKKILLGTSNDAKPLLTYMLFFYSTDDANFTLFTNTLNNLSYTTYTAQSGYRNLYYASLNGATFSLTLRDNTTTKYFFAYKVIDSVDMETLIKNSTSTPAASVSKSAYLDLAYYPAPSIPTITNYTVNGNSVTINYKISTGTVTYIKLIVNSYHTKTFKNTGSITIAGLAYNTTYKVSLLAVNASNTNNINESKTSETTIYISTTQTSFSSSPSKRI